MVKVVVIDLPVENCTPKVFYEAVYAKTSSTKKYHADVYGTQGVDVSDWVDGERQISCSMPLSLPDVLKNMIGGDSIPMLDMQYVTFQNNGEFEVDSSPQIQIRGGSGYKTKAKVAVKAWETGGSMVHAVVTCSAAGPWGMITFIEGIMAEQARTGMMKFLEFCKKEVVSQASIRAIHGRTTDDFLETQDAASESSFTDQQNMVSELYCIRADGSVYSAQSKPGVGMGGDGGITDVLQQLMNTSEEVQRSLKALSDKLDKIKQAQSKVLWRDFALTASIGVLLWIQLRKRN